jgi:outer membrane protein OmpA-like peptidoglycan-associated protein
VPAATGGAAAMPEMPAIPEAPVLGDIPGGADEAAVAMPETPAIPQAPDLEDPAGEAVGTEVAAMPEQPDIPAQPTFADPSEAAGGEPAASVPMVVPEPPEPAEPEETVRVASIFFEPGEADLANRDIDVLRLAVSERAARQGVIRIVGHADGPDPAAAAEVARDRADAIASALVRLGVLPSQMRLQTGGEAEPALAEAAEIYLDY